MESIKLAYSVEELAQMLSIGKRAAYDLVRSAGFPRIEVGRRLIVPVGPLEVWLERQATLEGGRCE